MAPSPIPHMRLLALPLTAQVGTLRPLVFYYAQMPSAAAPPAHSQAGHEQARAGGSGSGGARLVVRGRQLFKKGLDTATRTWVGLGKAPEKTWKNRLYSAGQRIYRRIDFEELALTSVEPALGPRIFDLGSTSPEAEGEKAGREAQARGERVTIPLLYPSIFPQPIQHLRALVEHRAPAHRRSMILYLVALPVTAPFALVPVIPNIPFFYCAWRAWSHYRAYRAATYLEKLVASHTIVPTPSPLLDKLYAGFPSSPPPPTPSPSSPTSSVPAPPTSPPASTSPTDADPFLLLTETDIKTLLAAFGLPEDGATELGIALSQARARVTAELRAMELQRGQAEQKEQQQKQEENERGQQASVREAEKEVGKTLGQKPEPAVERAEKTRAEKQKPPGQAIKS